MQLLAPPLENACRMHFWLGVFSCVKEFMTSHAGPRSDPRKNFESEDSMSNMSASG